MSKKIIFAQQENIVAAVRKTSLSNTRQAKSSRIPALYEKLLVDGKRQIFLQIIFDDPLNRVGLTTNSPISPQVRTNRCAVKKLRFNMRLESMPLFHLGAPHFTHQIFVRAQQHLRSTRGMAAGGLTVCGRGTSLWSNLRNRRILQLQQRI